MLLLVLKCLCRLDITSSFVSQILRVQRSPAPSLVEGAAAVFTPIFCRLPPHKGKYVCRLENSTNTTKNFQNTNYPFTSHSFRERSPKVSIFRLKYQMYWAILFCGRQQNQEDSWESLQFPEGLLKVGHVFNCRFTFR